MYSIFVLNLACVLMMKLHVDLLVLTSIVHALLDSRHIL